MTEHVSYGGPGHYAIIGDPRCGKTAGVLVPNILMLDDRPLIIFNDCRAELYRIIARHRRARGPLLLVNAFGLGQKISPSGEVYIDPKKPWLRGFKSDGFNILGRLDPLKPSFFSNSLAYGKSMILSQPNSAQPIFNVAAQQTASIMAMLAKLTFGGKASQAHVQTMIAMAQIPGKDLGENESFSAAAVASLKSQGIPEAEAVNVVKLFKSMLPRTPGAASAIIEKAIEGDYSPDPDSNAPCPYPQFDKRHGGTPIKELSEFAMQLKAKAGNDNRFFQDRIATCQTEMAVLNDPRLKEDMAKTPKHNGGPFEFKRMRDYVDRKRKQGVFTVVVMMPPEYFESHAVYSRAMISNCLNSLMEECDPEDSPLIPLVIIEEMQALGKISAVASQINMAAGSGIQYMMVFQQLSKMREAYGADSIGTLLGACDATLCFCSNDKQTQDYMSDLGGMKGEWVTSWGGKGLDGKPIKNESPQSVPLIRPQDIQNLKKGEAFCWIKHAPPVKLHVPGYFDTDAWPELRGKWDVNSTLPMNQRRAA